MSNNKHKFSKVNEELVYNIFVSGLYEPIDNDKLNKFLKDNKLTDDYINEIKK